MERSSQEMAYRSDEEDVGSGFWLCFSLALGLWAICLISLGLSSLICKMGTKAVPPSEGRGEDEMG